MFNSGEIQKAIEKQLEQIRDNTYPRYYIGIDVYDEIYAYCLMKKNIVDNSTEIILSKRMREKGFSEEVNNLSKYFNAEIIKEI